MFSEEEKKAQKSSYGWLEDELRCKKSCKNAGRQEKRHQAGNKWVGTGRVTFVPWI